MKADKKKKIYLYATIALFAAGLTYAGFRAYKHFKSKSDEKKGKPETDVNTETKGGTSQDVVDNKPKGTETETTTSTNDFNVLGKTAYTTRSRDAEVRKTKEDDSGFMYSNNVKTFDKGGKLIGKIVEVVPSGPGVVMYKIEFPESITDKWYGGSFTHGFVNFKNVTIK